MIKNVKVLMLHKNDFLTNKKFLRSSIFWKGKYDEVNKSLRVKETFYQDIELDKGYDYANKRLFIVNKENNRIVTIRDLLGDSLPPKLRAKLIQDIYTRLNNTNKRKFFDVMTAKEKLKLLPLFIALPFAGIGIWQVVRIILVNFGLIVL